MALDGYWVIGAFVVVVVTILLPRLSRSKSNFRRVGTDPGFLGLNVKQAVTNFSTTGPRQLEQNYAKAKDQNVIVRTLLTDYIVLSPKYLEELRMLPESKLNSSAALVDSVLGMHSGVDIILKDHLSADICRGQLTRNLPNLLPQMIEELGLAMSTYLENTTTAQYQPYHAYPFIFTMIHRVTSRVFVGSPVCHDEAWVRAVQAFPQDVEAVKAAVLPYPTILRPMILPFISAKKRLNSDKAAICKVLFPDGKPARSKEDSTLLNFLVSTSKDTDPQSLAQRLLVLNAAALHTSSMAATHAMYDLCAMPEYIEPLRAEAKATLGAKRDAWRLDDIKKLYRLDSFLKESQRMNQTNVFSFTRKVASPVQLSDGHILPIGTTIGMLSGSMARDAEFYSDPLKFDGFRFCRSDSSHNRDAGAPANEFTSIEPGNLSWGYGRFTCPGRWYAGTMIKLLLATILLDYDFQYPEGQTTRPANAYRDVHILPDFTQQILLRKREA
ncbi:MAG: hypothetical protein M1816_007293 [Peltula sp. TS41687]|nr:MAG: hypothetical protein M1816_007293 [Peltula sp. TS41687]